MHKEKLKQTLNKQGYRIFGEHCAVKICRWMKKSLIDEGFCYKQKFYGIQSHLCCQMSPWIECQNRCAHCWRPVDLDFKIKTKHTANPEEIIHQCIEQQKQLINGFRGNKKINLEKFKQAQEPMQFAISLIGEPTLYPNLAELIKKLREKKKTSFLVTNGLCPEILKKLQKNNSLPTQLYISLNSPNENLYNQWHRSSEKNAWKKFNESLALFLELKTRKVIRMTLVKGENSNMEENMIKDYAELIKKAIPDFIEVKGFMSIGFARNRKGMGYESMPTHKDIKEYAKKIAELLKDYRYKILDEHIFSRVVLIGKDVKKMIIKEEEI